MSKLMLLCLGSRKTESVASKFSESSVYHAVVSFTLLHPTFIKYDRCSFSGIHYSVIFALKSRLWVLFMWQF